MHPFDATWPDYTTRMEAITAFTLFWSTRVDELGWQLVDPVPATQPETVRPVRPVMWNWDAQG